MAERFGVSYRIFASSQAEAEGRAADIALEQTVEIPLDVVPKGYIADVVVGHVASVTSESNESYTAKIEYSMDAVGDGFSQLLNVIFGNSSIQKGLKVIGLSPNEQLLQLFPGANFGTDGLRALTGQKESGFVCPVIKPMGSTSEQLAQIAYLCARAGADIIKEDHGLANQPLAPFRQRVRLLAQTVLRANRERQAEGDSTKALYFPNLGVDMFALRDCALYAQDEGADGVIIIPGLLGFDAINALARDNDFNLPIMAHPSHLGPYVLSPDTGYTHAMMFGTMMRMAGADISVFPNVGGRFGFSTEQCLSIASACTDPDGYGIDILPSPGGGMSIERITEMTTMYGSDCVFLLGGGLLRHRERIGEAVKQMRHALSL